jgi:hypothetical protein
VVLIPEKVGAVEVKDFRPISLVGSIYNSSRGVGKQIERDTGGNSV